MDILVSRQPIFDAAEHVVAYRVFHQPQGDADERSGDESAHHLVVDAFLGVGIQRLTNGRPAFIAASAGLLRSGSVQLLDPDAVFLDVPNERLDAQTLEACERLHAIGYRLVIDGRALLEQPELVEFAAVLRVDVAGSGSGDATKLARENVVLLAANVQNREERAALADLGFEMFQGYEFSRPEVVVERDLSIDQVRALQLLRRIRDVDVTEHELADAFRSDVSLTYKLLRMVNSAAMGVSGIESIEHAMRMLGREALYRWLLLLFMSGNRFDGANREVLHTALLRARLCELTAQALHRSADRPSLYTTGLMSLLDILIGSPMEQILSHMGMSDEVARALIDREGFHGAVLRMVEAYDLGHWGEFGAKCSELGLEPGAVGTMYLEALVWASERMPEPQVA